IRELGDPKAGRDAARAGKMETFRKIYGEVLASDPAQKALSSLDKLARSKRICLMCYERNHLNCHRNIVASELESMIGCASSHLRVETRDPQESEKRRMLHTREGAAA
ncbi:MAG: DUF488 domain-containing protein, partial [Alphaproteobacteria bacterium]|nr:DUF488 domain-containing protein [Alphaproteobacteria bacterium]